VSKRQGIGFQKYNYYEKCVHTLELVQNQEYDEQNVTRSTDMRACVLVVEPGAWERRSLVEVLRAFDYAAVGTPTVTHALNALRGVAFDALVVAADPLHVEEIFVAAGAKKIQPDLKLIVVSAEPLQAALPPELDEYVQDPSLLLGVDDALSRIFPATNGRRP
jgi:hypothetical protein